MGAPSSTLIGPGAGFAMLPCVRRRYPFDTLHALRQRRVDRQAEVVGEQAARTARARRDEAHAEADRQSAERGIAESTQVEYDRLGDGQVRAGDLQVVGSWRRGAEAELKLKAERALSAREARAVEVAAEALARSKLEAASNEAKVIDTHRSDWHAERTAAEERSEEEAAAEQWTASHYPARRA